MPMHYFRDDNERLRQEEHLRALAPKEGDVLLSIVAAIERADGSVSSETIHLRADARAASHRMEALREFCQTLENEPDAPRVRAVAIFEGFLELPEVRSNAEFQEVLRRYADRIWVGPFTVRHA